MANTIASRSIPGTVVKIASPVSPWMTNSMIAMQPSIAP